jgi:hypothetical protein
METSHGQRIDFDIAQPHPRNRQPAYGQPPYRKRTDGERTCRDCAQGHGSLRRPSQIPSHGILTGTSFDLNIAAGRHHHIAQSVRAKIAA